MGEMVNNSSSSAGIDLSQFYQVFFEEAGENLEQMEQKLLELNVDTPDDEEMNAIFRCAHSTSSGHALLVWLYRKRGWPRTGCAVCHESHGRATVTRKSSALCCEQGPFSGSTILPDF